VGGKNVDFRCEEGGRQRSQLINRGGEKNVLPPEEERSSFATTLKGTGGAEVSKEGCKIQKEQRGGSERAPTEEAMRGLQS